MIIYCLQKLCPDPISELKFVNNNFDDESFAYILQALKDVKGLRYLEISHNIMDQLSIKALL